MKFRVCAVSAKYGARRKRDPQESLPDGKFTNFLHEYVHGMPRAGSAVIPSL